MIFPFLRRKAMRLALIAVFLIVSVVWFSPLFKSVAAFGQTVVRNAASCPLATGKAYRTPNVPTVYLVTPECTKRPFFNPAVYLSYFTDWSSVVFIEQPDMDRIPDDKLNFLPWGPRRTFENGSLVKVTSDPRVYLVLDAKAHPFEDEASFKSLGYSFSQIEDVAEAVLKKFTKQTATLKGASDAPASLVFKYLDDARVFVLKNDGDALVKSHILSMEDLNRIFRADRIAILQPGMIFPSGPDTGTAPSPSPVTPDPTTATSTSSTDMISISLPVGTSTVSGTFSIQATAVNKASVSSVQFMIGNAIVGTATSSLRAVSVDSTRFSNGSYTLTVTATDATGKTSVITRTLKVNNVSYGGGGGGGSSGGGGSPSVSDTTAPTVTGFSFPTSSTSLTISISSFTATDNTAVTGFLVNETSIAPLASAAEWTTSAPTSYVFSSIGSKTLYAWAKDAAGNVSTSLSATTTISDATPPVISSVASSTLATTATITWTTNESSTSTVQYGATTGYGSTSSSPASVTSHSIVLTGLTSNTLYHFRVGSQDAAGNTTTTGDYTFQTPDGTAPTVTAFAIPTTATSLTVSISTFTATDNVGVTGYLLTESSTAPVAGDAGWTGSAPATYVFASAGSKTLYAWAKDANGNVSTSLNDSVTITLPDTTPPVISAVASSTSATTATITWTTDEASTSTVQYGLTTGYGSASSSSASVTSHSIVLTGLTSNTLYHFRVGSQDVAGNATTTGGYAFRTTATPDTTPPVISAVASSTSATSATVTWTTDEASTPTVQYGATTGYGSTSSSAASVTSHSIVLTGLTSNTLYHFRVGSQDAAGNATSTGDYTFRTLDGTAPTVTAFTIPATAASLVVSVSTFTATDNVAVTGYMLTESSSAPATGDAGWEVTATTTYTFASAGSKTLYAWAKDAAGNVSTSLNDSVTITLSDTTPPVISAVASSTSATTATITWTTDEASTSTVQYGTTTGYGSVSSSALNVTSHSIAITGLIANTLYHFRVGSQDAGGNATTTGDYTMRTLAIDVTPPVISGVSSSTGATSAIISWTTNEAATSTVEYGTSISYGSLASSAVLGTSHSIEITGLSSSALYHFRVKSQDASENTGTSGDYTFTTTAAGSIDLSIIPADRRTVWNPGLNAVGGIPNRTTICGATIYPSGGDDTAIIQSALNSCPDNQVVLLGPGTFNITGNGLSISRSNITLRGSGIDQTKLVKPTGTSQPVIHIGTRYTFFDDQTLLASDALKESNTITLSGPPPSGVPLAVGELVVIDHVTNNLTWWNPAPNRSPGGGPEIDVTRGWFSEYDRPIGQVMEIQSVEGNQITFTTGLHTDFLVVDQAQLSRFFSGTSPVTAPVQRSGVEDLYMAYGEGGDGGGNVHFTVAKYSWVKNVESDLSLGTSVNVDRSLRCVVRDSFIHSTVNPVPGGAGYGIGINFYAADNLIENNISWNFNKIMMMRASGGGNVIGYNYLQDGWGSYYPNIVEAGMNASHMTTPHMELFEGNESHSFSGDATWGNSIYITALRNSLTTKRTAASPLNIYVYTDGAGQKFYFEDEYNRNAVILEYGHHYYNFIGNVLGTSDMTLLTDPKSLYKVIQTAFVYVADGVQGHVPMWNFTGSSEQSGNDSSVSSTAMIHGNYDYVTNSVTWDPSNSNHVIPDTLYLTSKPAFFGANLWPWVTPESVSTTHVLPAKVRFSQIMNTDSEAPVITQFDLPGTYSSLIIPVTMAATDNVGVLGYKITTTSTPPVWDIPGFSGWVATAPTSTISPNIGAQQFYAWAEDAVGNVSSVGDPVIVEVNDSTVIWEDLFDRADGNPENGWLALKGAVHTIQSNALYRTGDLPDSLSVNPVGGILPQDYYLTVTMTPGYHQYFGIVARWLDGNGIRVSKLDTGGSPVAVGWADGYTSHDVEVMVTGGRPSSWSLTQNHTMGMHIAGATVTIYLDGQEYGYATLDMNNVVGTGVGITGAGKNYSWPDIKVTNSLPVYNP